ncbi:aminomethyl-transferring glycine dehydrogenase [Candidatus Puniceispirillum sp.]|nr:aminomethyl-transferring glycine dehydrogenase [Candidatus Puniceispirillum sp.]
MSSISSPQAPFVTRHIGLDEADTAHMLDAVNAPSMDAFLESVIPANIRRQDKMALSPALSEHQILTELRSFADDNQIKTSLIGMGYYNCYTPPVIQRNILENPSWYTAYTPYQPEISQGRLEAILNFQTMITDLTGMDIANGSLLDEATAAAEAMALANRTHKARGNRFLVDPDTHPQTISILQTRAEPLGIIIDVQPVGDEMTNDYFGGLLSYPSSSGMLRDLTDEIAVIHNTGGLAVVCADLLALTLVAPPGEMGADIVVGSAQRFGVPFSFGGPHAAYFACNQDLQRSIPGRIVGVSRDSKGRPAYRLALQTREQHIRREKATSNICTAQALLAIMASFYAVWHGPEGLKNIAAHSNRQARRFGAAMMASGRSLRHQSFFDTVVIETGDDRDNLLAAASAAGFNLRPLHDAVAASFDETIDDVTLAAITTALGGALEEDADENLPTNLARNSPFLTHQVFHNYRSETEMLRYMRRLADRDLALDRCMIPLGSCTMKLNATVEMIPVTWPEFANIHPYAPVEQTKGYRKLITKLENMLCQCTGYSAMSIQPNAGAQGEFAGLLAISRYHQSRGEHDRNICLIPASAHGTNPASAAMAGMRVVVVKCDAGGNVDLDDLRAKAIQYKENVAALMVTYPSTHGVFEESIAEICDITHRAGGQVYVDGANLNALVGYCAPPQLGADVGHLNLHKTFCIPHGGGGPGVGPIGVAPHLAPFLPGSPFDGKYAVSAAPFGSAGILPITYSYIRMMGPDGLLKATATAILSANYIAQRLRNAYPILYTGRGGRVAHECIIDMRQTQTAYGISNEDIAKRLIDYGFHAPTMSFPVAGTLMIEPTESESLAEIDRFCDAMIAIANEINTVAIGVWPLDDNPLVNAPHTSDDIMQDEWTHPYSRKQAGDPEGNQQENKYWPPVNRVNNALGDRSLICSCPPMEFWEQKAAE